METAIHERRTFCGDATLHEIENRLYLLKRIGKHRLVSCRDPERERLEPASWGVLKRLVEAEIESAEPPAVRPLLRKVLAMTG